MVKRKKYLTGNELSRDICMLVRVSIGDLFHMVPDAGFVLFSIEDIDGGLESLRSFFE